MKFKKGIMAKQRIANIEENIYVSINGRLNETALVINGNFYILNGDYQKDIEKMTTLEEIKKFFKDNESKKSSRSKDEFDF